MSGYASAVSVTFFGWLASCPLIVFLCKRLGAGRYAGPIAFLALTSPGLLFYASVPMSDAPFFMVSAAGFACLAIGFESRRAMRWIALAGLLAGVSITLRTIGLANVAAYPIYVVYRFVSDRPKADWVTLGKSLVPWFGSAASAADRGQNSQFDRIRRSRTI
ncbi:MAG: hypothetical protein QM811_06280 [Pirellulales bacterium]